MAKNNNGNRHITNPGRDLYHRHYCKTCNKRVFPYDSLESLTVAPAVGAKGGPILLFSANSAQRERDPENISRTAWCWFCDKWTQTYRETRYDTMLRYLKRRGIQFRFAGKSVAAQALPSEKSFVKALDNRVEDRRAGGGTLTIKRR